MTKTSKTKIYSPLDYAQNQIKSILSDVEIYKDENRNLIKISPNTIIPLVKCLLFPDDNREELNLTCDSAVASGFDKESKFFTIFYNEVHRLYISDYQIKPNNVKWEISNIIYNSFFECLIDQILKSFNPNHKVKISHLIEAECRSFDSNPKVKIDNLAKEEQKKISKIVTKKDVCKFLFDFIGSWEKYQQNNFTKINDLSVITIDTFRAPIESMFELLKNNRKVILPYLKELEEFLPELNVKFEKGYRAIERFVLSVNFVHKFFHQEISKNKNITTFVECENGNLRKVTRTKNYLFGAKECDLIFSNKSSFFDISKYHNEYNNLKVRNITIEGFLIKESLLFLDREEFLIELFKSTNNDNDKTAQSIKIIKSKNLGQYHLYF